MVVLLYQMVKLLVKVIIHLVLNQVMDFLRIPVLVTLKSMPFAMPSIQRIAIATPSSDIKKNSVFYDAKFLKKATLYVVRTDNDNNYINSAPCKDCFSIIFNLNIKKIIFSFNLNDFKIFRTEDYNTDHVSNGNRFLKNKSIK